MVHGVLDEMMDFVAEMTQEIPKTPQSPPDFISLLTGLLIPKTASPMIHGETQEERQIYEIDETQNKETENINQ